MKMGIYARIVLLCLIAYGGLHAEHAQQHDALALDIELSHVLAFETMSMKRIVDFAKEWETRIDQACWNRNVTIGVLVSALISIVFIWYKLEQQAQNALDKEQQEMSDEEFERMYTRYRYERIKHKRERSTFQGIMKNSVFQAVGAALFLFISHELVQKFSSIFNKVQESTTGLTWDYEKEQARDLLEQFQRELTIFGDNVYDFVQSCQQFQHSLTQDDTVKLYSFYVSSIITSHASMIFTTEKLLAFVYAVFCLRGHEQGGVIASNIESVVQGVNHVGAEFENVLNNRSEQHQDSFFLSLQIFFKKMRKTVCMLAQDICEGKV